MPNDLPDVQFLLPIVVCGLQESTIDPCHVIRLIRALLPAKAIQTAHPSSSCEGESERGGTSSERVASSQEEASESEERHVLPDEDGEKETAGCILWDLSSSEEHADFMVTAKLLLGWESKF